MTAVAVVGGGRVGLSLARALAAGGSAVAVLGRRAEPLPDNLGVSTPIWEPALAASDLVLVAVPDDRLPLVALELMNGGAISAHQTVLHTSGLLDSSVLAALRSTEAALGSFHPLQTFRDPAGTPAVLRGAPAILEGDIRAVARARELAALLEMSPVVEIPAGGKARYHAAAVFASNYLVVLADVAARLARGAGIEATSALFMPLMLQTLQHLEQGDPAGALSGPVRRGDVGTVAAHLSALDPATRQLYLMLAREAVSLAERDGLDGLSVERLRALLTD